MAHFIFFFDPGFGDDEERIPIATGASREEATSKGIPRLLEVAALGGMSGLMHSSGVAIEQPNLTDEDIAKIDQTIEEFFAKAKVRRLSTMFGPGESS